MRRSTQENASVSKDCPREGFALALVGDETRRQARACGALCGLILVALLASVFSGTE
ncbi:MAG: hypothetical protein ACK4MV_13580 [Beijerinckiaceae bacterium]